MSTPPLPIWCVPLLSRFGVQSRRPERWPGMIPGSGREPLAAAGWSRSEIWVQNPSGHAWSRIPPSMDGDAQRPLTLTRAGDHGELPILFEGRVQPDQVRPKLVPTGSRQPVLRPPSGRITGPCDRSPKPELPSGQNGVEFLADQDHFSRGFRRRGYVSGEVRH